MNGGSRPAAAASRPRAVTVLVVEDDPANQALLRRVLEDEGYRVQVVGDGPSGLRAINAAQPDLVLLDVGLPDIDGYEVTRRVRSDSRQATLPILLLTGRTGVDEVVTGLEAGADDYIAKPFARPELVARIASALRLRRALVGMEAAHAVVTALANAVEAKDALTERHCERLALMGARLGHRAGLSGPELDAVTYGALLHDVGKIGVPDAILTKPGPLTEAEWVVIRRHPEIGERICAPLASFAAFGPIIRHHHEHWDGSGYPDGLRGEAIGLGARIVGLVDAFDAMTHDRPYRPSRSVDGALDEIRREAGRQFDPELVRLFAEEASRAPMGRIEAEPDPVTLLIRPVHSEGALVGAARGR